MDLDRVRDAYTGLAGQYVDLYAAGWQDDEQDTALVLQHLTGLAGRVLDAGCGPGHWSALLHARGVDVAGVDLVPAFVEHARAASPGLDVRLGSMTALDADDATLAGVLAWYSTIHLPPPALPQVLTELRRVLVVGGPLVVGFFAAEDDETTARPFAHAVTTAFAWPVDLLARTLREAGFAEVARRQHRLPERPDRRYGTLVLRAA